MTSLFEESVSRMSNGNNGFNGADIMTAGRNRRRRKQHSKQTELTLSSSHVTAIPSDDDAASICSGVSSASGSSGGGGKVGKKHHKSDRTSGKRSSQRCQLHGCIDGVINTNSNDSCDVHIKCTCQKHSRRQMACRPEPEGGTTQQTNSVQYYKSTMDEFDRLIYGPSEPLFSDCDCIDDDALAELPETKPHQSRGLGGTDDVTVVDILLKTAQVINTNTLMKLAIIQTELKNVKDASIRRLDNELATLSRRMESLNDSCNQTEPNLASVRQQLYETRTQLVTTNSDAMLSQHSCNCDKKTSADDVRRHITPMEFPSNQLIPADVDIETFAASIDSSELRVANLEEQLKSVVKATSQSNEKEIRDVTLRLKEAEQCSLRAEQQLFNARYTTDRLSEEWSLNLKKHKPIANTLRSVSFADVIEC